MTDLTTPRAPERAVPAPRAPGPPPAAPPAVPPATVELTRLLALARLTGPQALELGAGLLDAVVERAVEGPEPDTVNPLLTSDGRVALGPGGAGTRPVAGVLAEVIAAAGLPTGGGEPDADGPLAALDRARTSLGSEGVAAVARGLREAATRIDRPAARAELAALSGAVGALPGSAAGGAGASPPAATRARTAVRPPARPPRRPRSAGRRIGAWLLSLVVLAGVVAAEALFLGDDITTDIDLLLDAGRGEDEPAAEPEPDGLPVTAPAPASAGSVAAVDLRPLARCEPGAPCTLRLLVRLTPSPDPQTLTWSYRVVDRCTGASTSVPGGTVVVPPQADRAAVVAEVALPPLAGVAVLAVTEEPATAASAPVSAGSCRPAGPGA